MTPNIPIPYLQVRNNCLLLYHQSDFRPGRKLKLFKPAYTGKVSSGVAKRIGKAVDILLQLSPVKQVFNPILNIKHDFTVGFVTLTIPDSTKISATDGYNKLLKPFIRVMRTRYKFDYIWKVELQKRGQLHWHITWNEWVHYLEIRKEWNKILRREGFLNGFGLKYKHYDPNSTDVHAVYKVGNIAAYLSKYLEKENSKAVKGKIWDCSKRLKSKRWATVFEYYNDGFLRDGIKKGSIKVIELEQCTIFKGANIMDALTPEQFKDYDIWRT
jgi:hypothetical protein